MTIKFDCFKNALRQLCETYEVDLFCLDDGTISVEDSYGDYIIPAMEDLTGRLEE